MPFLSLASTNGPSHGDKETARFETRNPFTVLVDKVNVTPTKPSVIGFEFSLYSNFVSFASSLSLSLKSRLQPFLIFLYHQDTAAALQDSSIRHPFLTPVRARPNKEVGLTILKNASDRVTEILRENRRRLDAGEDPNTLRSTLDVKPLHFDIISLISIFSFSLLY